MIYSLNGKIIHKEASLAVIECGGVGYACRTTAVTLERMGEIGSQARLYTYMSVREDAVELFGFADSSELSCFRQLLSVSGVGGKAALSILSEIPAHQTAMLIASGDSKAFTKVKGIGAKTAQRIVLELNDKIKKENIAFPILHSASAAGGNANSVSDAVSALMVLGYSNAEIMPVLSKLPQELETSEIIRRVLKCFSENK